MFWIDTDETVGELFFSGIFRRYLELIIVGALTAVVITLFVSFDLKVKTLYFGLDLVLNFKLFKYYYLLGNTK